MKLGIQRRSTCTFTRTEPGRVGPVGPKVRVSVECETDLRSDRGDTPRLCLIFAISLLLLRGIAIGAEGEAPKESPRDWKANPAIVSLSMPVDGDLYAMGDAHGDVEVMARLLAGTGIIRGIPARPDAVQWAAGKSVLVITGDFIDRYDHSMEVIAMLRALQSRAAEAGGRVVITMGNHEAEFLAGGGENKKAEQFGQELHAAGLSPTDVASGRDAAGIGLFLRNLPMAARVGDWFFCHAGNTHGQTITELEEALEKGIVAEGFAAPILSDPDSLLEARMHPRPWWLASPTVDMHDVPSNAAGHSDDPGKVRLEENLAALGARHLVFGHQPGKLEFPDGTQRAKGQVFMKYDGLVFLIDTGMSRGVDAGRGAVLKIHSTKRGATVSAVYADRQETMLQP